MNKLFSPNFLNSKFHLVYYSHKKYFSSYTKIKYK